ncbi:MAG: DUF3024 domain-containing protein [Candidatus Moranbacteria bacterium]|nr:DUF3024 domain-containing protein [Candidatus Moranbacteria bacterium]
MTDPTIQKIEEKFKVPEHVADKIQNVAEKSGNSYILYETRPTWDGSAKPWTKLSVAKMTFVKISGRWKLFWMRASGKWEFYGGYKSFKNVLNMIEKDKFGCFWG